MSKCVWRKGGSKKYVLEEEYLDRIPFETDEFVIDTLYCTLVCDGTIIIRKGYEWDGASGPTIDTDDTMDGSLVHDVLYQLIREGKLPRKLRKKADRCIRQMCIEDGLEHCKTIIERVWVWLRFNYWYFFLRIAGGGSANAR
jgi:hypothetical protein